MPRKENGDTKMIPSTRSLNNDDKKFFGLSAGGSINLAKGNAASTYRANDV